MTDREHLTTSKQHDGNEGSGHGTSRRTFLKGTALGLAGAGGLAALAAPKPARAWGDDLAERTPAWVDRADRLSDRALFRKVRRAFVLDKNVTYMNVGTTGSMPRHVLRAYRRNNRLIAENPRENLGGTSAMRARIAPQFGCNPDELVISGNTTEGMCMSLNGVTLEAGDAIITTNHEHPAGIAPLALLRDRRGVAVIPVTLPVGTEQSAFDYVDLFAQAIADARARGLNPRMMVFSAPTFVTGTMLPIRMLADLAIAEGIYTLVDGAHASGMFDLDFHGLGIDFFAGSGHKWQCGPGGTGVWYIRNQTDSNPLPLPRFYPTRTLVYDVFGSDVPVPDGDREPSSDYDVGLFNQSHGNPNYPANQALVDSCDFWTAIGRLRIEDHILGLSDYTKARIVDYWGIEALRCPKDDPELVSALTSFVPLNAFAPTDGARSSEFVTRLREEYGFVVRNTSVAMPQGGPNHRPLRISTHLFHDLDDVDGVIDAAIDLSEKMAAGA
ncbi:MAG: aminotransferase class V-fold PLP-dependent enzyme [Kiloniellales bacterium]|nr:aminotransferase class V-fold PLP-dependent enzyme [Kiloniellales bacterium]